MASIITADNGVVSGSAGIKSSADSSGVLALASGTGTTAVTIDTSQNVGIGTNPSAWPASTGSIDFGNTSLNSVTSAVANASGNAFLVNNAYYNGTSWKYKASYYATLYASGDGTHRWSYAASGTAGNTITFTEAMRIDSSGNLLVGTTATFSGSTSYITTLCDGGTKYGITIKNLSSVSVSNALNFLNSSGTQVGRIELNNTGTSYATSSDYRLKDNPQPMTGALARVAQLKPVTYTWKSDGSGGEGFIAHELAEVCPQAVVGEKDAVNEDGSIKAQGIDTSFLVATLTAAIQEQQAQISSQAAVINNLTERLAALEAK